ncbi:MAG: MarR family winged helix-turn-helix transcriptional regulator [Candidatus Dormibacteria bacterium]
MTALDSGPGRLAEAVDAVQGWIDRRQRHLVAKLHTCPQSPAQLHVLGVLAETGPVTVSSLASQLGISAPSASAIVDRMVDTGLVERERSDEDRRVVTVAISPAGRSVIEQVIGGRREMLVRVLGQLSEDELSDTIRILARLEEALGAVATQTGGVSTHE